MWFCCCWLCPFFLCSLSCVLLSATISQTAAAYYSFMRVKKLKPFQFKVIRLIVSKCINRRAPVFRFVGFWPMSVCLGWVRHSWNSLQIANFNEESLLQCGIIWILPLKAVYSKGYLEFTCSNATLEIAHRCEFPRMSHNPSAVQPNGLTADSKRLLLWLSNQNMLFTVNFYALAQYAGLQTKHSSWDTQFGRYFRFRWFCGSIWSNNLTDSIAFNTSTEWFYAN